MNTKYLECVPDGDGVDMKGEVAVEKHEKAPRPRVFLLLGPGWGAAEDKNSWKTGLIHLQPWHLRRYMRIYNNYKYKYDPV